MSPSDEIDTQDDVIDLVTVYLLVYCVYADGTQDGPWTQTFDVDVISPIGTVIDMAEDVAQAFCAAAPSRGYGRGAGEQSTTVHWEITAPTYFVYSRGL